MANKYMATYYTGYCGTDERLFIIADNEEQVAAYMEEGLYDYAEGWTHLASGWGESMSDEEFEEFLEDCGYDIVEINEDNIDEIYEDYEIDEDDFEDIT